MKRIDQILSTQAAHCGGRQNRNFAGVTGVSTTQALVQRLGNSAQRTVPVVMLLGFALTPSQVAYAQVAPAPLNATHTSTPWAGGTNADAQVQSVLGATIPMSTFTRKASKDGKSYTSTIVGTSPFDKILTGTTINAVVVPLIFPGSVPFDPTLPDLCDGGVTSLARFQKSPLTQNSPLTMEGRYVGNTQFINGFRRAEFWLTINGSSAYQNTINFTYSQPVSISGAPITLKPFSTSSGCPTTLGILPAGGLQFMLETQVIPNLQKAGVIDPTKFVIFLLHNVVQADPSCSNCYTLGTHGAVGNPVQTYAFADWDTTTAFVGGADGASASHEIAEWMDDPLVTNTTPAWGKLGQAQPTTNNPTGCVTTWEGGDPLSGKVMPVITLSGYPYHMQELAFFSFFFNSATDPSVGASYYIYNQGTFSSNGSFLSPANACPAGGLAPFGGKWIASPNPAPPSAL